MNEKSLKPKSRVLDWAVIFLVPFLFLLQSPYGFVAIFLLLLIHLSANYKICFSKNSLIILSAFPFFVFPVFVSSLHGYSHFFYFLLTILTFFSAKSLSEVPLYKLFIIVRALFWTFTLFAFFVYWSYRDLAEPFSGLIEGSSTNGIPSYLIVFQVVYSLLFFALNQRLPIVSVLFTILIAILGIGRGSIYVSALILLFSFSFNFFLALAPQHHSRLLLYSSIFLGVFILFYFSVDYILAYLDARTKALQGVYDPYRERILYEYLSKISWWQVFSGGAYENTVISSLYDNNPHIAFIRSHAYLGVWYFIFIIFSPLFFFLFSRSLLNSVVFFCFSALLLLRAASEPILFPTALDLFYFVIFFVYSKRFLKTVAWWSKDELSDL